MLPVITEEELLFMESYFDPVCLTECLFSDFDKLSLFEEKKFGHVRLGQLPLLSYEHVLDDEPALSEKENYQRRKSAGDVYAFGGRLFGKTLCVEKIDMAVDIACSEKQWCGFCSYDAIHIRGVLEDIITFLEHHPFFKIFNPRVTRSPNYRIYLEPGYLVESVNMNLAGKNPGAQFFQKHFSRLYIEEASFETEDIYKTRRDSVSENGCVMRFAGMTNFTKYSPCGRIFYDLNYKPWIVNLPQYVNPKWDSKEKEKAVKDLGGEQSIPYRVFVKGEVVEEGISVFDMQRVRQNYLEDKRIKTFEITKENFSNFEDLLIVERPTNASFTYIASDIGESAPSELAIFFLINEKYRYVYNITLYNLTDKQQRAIFKFLADKLNANIMALDTTEGTGRAIFRSLEEEYGREHMVWVHFGEKIPIDLEKDVNNNIVFEAGQPKQKEEYVAEWSIKHLKNLLYDNRIELPMDFKLDVQLNSVVSVQSGVRTIYSCIAEEDHLFAAFRVFAIAQWFMEFQLIKPINKKPYAKSGV